MTFYMFVSFRCVCSLHCLRRERESIQIFQGLNESLERLESVHSALQ